MFPDHGTTDALRGADTAYDPFNKVYLVVGLDDAGLLGIFVNTAGQPVTGKFLITARDVATIRTLSRPHARFSPDLQAGLVVIGSGGFLVTWHEQIDATGNWVLRARIVGYPGVVGSAANIADEGGLGGGGTGLIGFGGGIAYSTTSRMFFVVWQRQDAILAGSCSTCRYGIQGALVDLNGQRAGSVIDIDLTGWAQFPSVAWNPASDEFGVSYSQGADGGGLTHRWAYFARVSNAGVVLANSIVQDIGAGGSIRGFPTEIDVNTLTGRWVLVWTRDATVDSAELDSTGSIVGVRDISIWIKTDLGLGLSFNRTSGTFLFVGGDLTGHVLGTELDGHGVQFGPAAYGLATTYGAYGGSHWPRLAPQTGAGKWNLAFYAFDVPVTSQIIATTLISCIAPDPYASLGGGICNEGEWSAPKPALTSGGAPAQPLRVTDTTVLASAPALGTDVAYDPVHHVSLVVGANGPLTAVFVDDTGQRIGLPMTIGAGDPVGRRTFARVAFGAGVNAGAGGFLVTWNQDHGPSDPHYFVHAQLFAYPGGALGSEFVIADEGNPTPYYVIPVSGAPAAYSNTSSLFFVVWQGQQCSFDCYGIFGQRVAPDGSLVGGAVTIEPPIYLYGNYRTLRPEVAWNPLTNEFGVSYTGWIQAPGSGGGVRWGAAFFARVTTAGIVAFPGLISHLISNAGGNQVFANGVDCNTATGHWLVAWWEGGATTPRIKVAELDEHGRSIRTTPFIGDQFLVSTTAAGSSESIAISYNAASGTFLLVGLDSSGTGEVVGAELDGHGGLLGAERAITRLGGAAAYYPRVAPQSGTKKWTVAFSRDGSALMDQIVSSSTGGGADGGGETIPGPGGQAGPNGSSYVGIPLASAPVRGTDIAFDAANQIYLVVGANGPLTAAFMDRAGQRLGNPFTLTTGVNPSAVMPRVRYGAAVNNGAGGFLVTWNQIDAGSYTVHARAVAYPAGPIGSEGVIGDAGPAGAGGFVGTGAAVAYSVPRQIFYVVWQRQDFNATCGCLFGIRGRQVDLGAQPIGSINIIENLGNARFPSVASSPTDVFGVSYSRDITPAGGASYSVGAAYFASIPIIGVGPNQQVYDAGSDRPQATDISFNPALGTWMMAWFQASNGSPSQIRAAELSQFGSPVSTPTGPSQFLVSTRLAGNPNVVSLAYNVLSQTFLLAGIQAGGQDVLGLQLSGHGTPIGGERIAATALGGTIESPRLASTGGIGFWGLSFSKGGNTLMSRIVSMTPGGPAAAASSGPAVVDFTGDGRSDLIWQDPVSGEAELWEMNRGTHVGSTRLTAGGTLWQIVGTGDFNGDGKPDIIWQHPSTGAVLLWTMNGSTYVSSTILNSGGTYWKIVAVGDFTGDGKPDLVWQLPATGAALLWEMNGATYVQSFVFSTGSTYWQIVGAGDFTGDGQTDLLWQHPSTGAVLLWQMSGISYAGSFILNAGTGWRIAAVADFTGDGKPDIVWQDPPTGEGLLWEMNGTTYVSGALFNAAGASWMIRGPR